MELTKAKDHLLSGNFMQFIRFILQKATNLCVRECVCFLWQDLLTVYFLYISQGKLNYTENGGKSGLAL